MQMLTRTKFIILLSIILPIALSLWTGNIIFKHTFGVKNISLTRWISSLLVPIFFIYWGLKRNSLSTSGAIAGFLVGFVITLTNYAFLSCLIVFFVSSSKATKFRSHLKVKFEDNFYEAGKRNWIQIFCNGIVATSIALMFLIDCGSQEQPLDLNKQYRCTTLCYALIGSFSCCNGDTWASELGSVVSFSKPVLLTSFKPVPKGTNGAISIAGLITSLLGGMLVGFAYFVTLHITVPSASMRAAPSQWPVICLGGVGGLLGSLIDSFMGATLQYSGINKEGKIVEHPGPGIKYISGRHFLDNHSVNILSNFITACLLPCIAIYVT